MKFKKWVKLSGLRPGDIAKELGCHRTTVHNYMEGRRRPATIDRIEEIRRLSGGQVTFTDWLK